jgi:hypothetical protein
MGVEKPLDPVKRFTLQIAPVIFVDNPDAVIVARVERLLNSD